MTIDDCVKLYQMMAHRCASSDFAPNQARIYGEMVNFISACDSVEESLPTYASNLSFQANL